MSKIYYTICGCKMYASTTTQSKGVHVTQHHNVSRRQAARNLAADRLRDWKEIERTDFPPSRKTNLRTMTLFQFLVILRMAIRKNRLKRSKEKKLQ